MIGMTAVITGIPLAATLQGLRWENIVSCVVGRGTTTTSMTSTAPPIAPGSIPVVRTTTSGFVALARCLEF